MQDKAPEEVSRFQSSGNSGWTFVLQAQQKREDNKELDGQFIHAQLTDLIWQRWSRLGFAIIITILLFMQNLAIFWLIYKAFEYGTLKQLEWFLGTLITGTLIETYKVLGLMLEWLFKDRKYTPDHTVKKVKSRVKNN